MTNRSCVEDDSSYEFNQRQALENIFYRDFFVFRRLCSHSLSHHLQVMSFHLPGHTNLNIGTAKNSHG